MLRSLLSALALASALTACVIPAPRRDLGTLSTSGTAVSADALALVSGQRRAAGLGPVSESRALAEAAQVQAAHQAGIGTMTHVGPQGSRLDDRLATAGAPRCKTYENVADGWRTPEQVVRAWMASPKHRANILRARAERAAVAYADAAGGKRYWAMVIAYC
jgi:uncharacterized protein YkwD